jgi:ribosomal protein S18 acetylase RimI-like enzyme
MEKIQILRADRSQAEMLSQMGAETFYTYFGKYNSPDDMEDYVSKAFSVNQVKAEMDEVGSVFFIAYVNGSVAGYARLRLSTEKINELEGTKPVELQRIYVLPAYLSKKVGIALMQQMLDHCRDNGFDTLWLGVWEKNDRAFSFYEKLGFKKFGSHIFMLGKDAQTDILMKRRI